MTLNYDTTPEQDAAITELRKKHNRETGQSLNDRQFVKLHIDHAMAKIVEEAASVSETGIRDSYRGATPEVRAQIDTLLGR